MSEPIRYSVCHINEKTIDGHFVTCKAGTIEHPEGAMVSYKDYAALKAEVQTLRHQAVHDVSQLGEQSAEIAHLKAEVERLEHQIIYWRIEAEVDNERVVKAGDLLCFHYISLGRKLWPDGPLPSSVTGWNAAKEGKQS